MAQPRALRCLDSQERDDGQLLYPSCTCPLTFRGRNNLISYILQGECEHKRVKHWYGLTNKNGHEKQIAQKQQRAAVLRQLKKSDIEVKKAREQAEADGVSDKPPLKRKRGRPRKETYFGFADDTPDEPLNNGVPCEIHHHIPNGQTQWDDYLTVVAKNPDDSALQVSTCCIPVSSMLTWFGRNLYLICTTTFSRGYSRRISKAGNTRSPRRNATGSAL